jgi:hypothetical protein
VIGGEVCWSVRILYTSPYPKVANLHIVKQHIKSWYDLQIFLAVLNILISLGFKMG